jgi:hypothetical protein
MTAYIRKAKWMHVLIPLVVLTLYCVSLSWFLSWLLPEYGTNVNAAFVDGAWKFSLLAAGLYPVFLALFKLYRILEPYIVVQDHKEKKPALKTKKGERPAFKNSIEKFDFILILLPLTPVVQYILNNQDILSPWGSLYVFAVFAAFSALFIIIVPTLLGIIGSTKTLMILGLAFTFMITNMAYLSAESHWYERGDLATQLFLLSAVFLVSWILYNLIGRKFLYILVAIFFIANSAIQLASQDVAKTALPSANNELAELVGSRKPLSTPDIYLLLYDAYVANETMLGYGIDNSAQEKYLELLGFELYPHTYSVGGDTLSTMSRTLNASTELYGDYRRAVSGDGIVQSLLRSFGYQSYGIFPINFFFQGIGSDWDVSFPETSSSPDASSAHKLVMKAILMGEFRFNLDFDQPSEEQFEEYTQSVFESVADQPKFVFMYRQLPMHTQNSGRCLPNETELFDERLARANYAMRRDIETIVQKDPGAIVVVTGDHGPYLTKNCTTTGGVYGVSEISRLDIQDRFGCFLAIKWPTEGFSQYDDITVHQDIFPAVFAYLFKDDSLLQARVASRTLYPSFISGASVENGTIHGGINDGEPLFVGQ